MAATSESSSTSEDEMPRRLAIGAGLIASALAVKAYIVDGGMTKLELAPNSMKGRTVVITGGNTGLGLESAVRLAKAGATIVITARTEEKGIRAVEMIKAASKSSDVHCVQMDLADLQSVKEFPAKFEAQPYGSKIDVLMNNAGVMAIPQRLETKDGFERQLGVNHLGHFALVGVVLPFLMRADGFARVINVSSLANVASTKELMQGDLMDPARYTAWGAYCQSKLANVLFAKELDRRFKAAGVKATAVSCHPGTVDTDLARWIVGGSDNAQVTRDIKTSNAIFGVTTPALSRDVGLGANTQVYLAAGRDGGYDKSGGMYFDNMQPAVSNPLASDESLAKEIWDKSAQLTGVTIKL